MPPTIPQPTDRVLTLAVQILVILTIVVAVFTKNYALVVVALVCGVAVILFNYLKNLPKSVSMFSEGDQHTVDTEKNAAPIQTSSPQTMATLNSLNYLQGRPKMRPQARPLPQSTDNRQQPNKLLMAAYPRGTNHLPWTRKIQRQFPSLAAGVPQNETMESKVGRSLLLRQEADLPVPRQAIAAFDRAMLKLAPLPPGPNMQLVTPEELAREKMQAAPLFQRVHSNGL